MLRGLRDGVVGCQSAGTDRKYTGSSIGLISGGCFTAIAAPDGRLIRDPIRSGEGVVIANLDFTLIDKRKQLMASRGPYATAAAAALAAADVLVNMAAGKVPNSFDTVIYGAVAFGVGLGWFLIDRARGGLQPASPAGIACAMGVGVAFSIVAVALYGAFPGRRAAVDRFTRDSSVRAGGGQRLGSHCLERAGDATVRCWPVYGVTGVYLIVTR